MNSRRETQDFNVKILMLGHTTVGKTTFLDCLINGPRDSSFPMTTGKFFFNIHIKKQGPDYSNFSFPSSNGNGQIKASIWDTVGQEKYRSINKSFYQKAHGALLLADVTHVADERDLTYWLNEFREGAGENTRIILVGNKIDLGGGDEATILRLIKFAQENDLPFYKTSAKTGENVKFVMGELIKQIESELMDDNEENFMEENDFKDDHRNFDNKRTILETSTLKKSQKKEKSCCLGC